MKISLDIKNVRQLSHLINSVNHVEKFLGRDSAFVGKLNKLSRREQITFCHHLRQIVYAIEPLKSAPIEISVEMDSPKS